MPLKVNRQVLKIEADRFTTDEALAKEVVALIENSDAKVVILAHESALLRISQELEDRVLMGRVKVVMVT
jgi:hypothetical protein